MKLISKLFVLLFLFAFVITSCDKKDTNEQIENEQENFDQENNNSTENDNQNSDSVDDLGLEIVLLEFVITDNVIIKDSIPNLEYNVIAILTEVELEGGFFQELLLLSYLDEDKIYLIDGIPMPHRPLTNIIWKDEQLHFDRWSSPHFGYHYVINVNKKELISANELQD